jgi:PPOX class probable F420-dependent enzyme
MPRAPVSPAVDSFLSEARPAVMATVRPDGLPVSVATWYGWEDGHILLSMNYDAQRLEHLRQNPGVALTVLGDSWYTHVSLIGRAIEFREDPEMADCDAMSMHYRGEPYPRYPDMSLVTVLVAIERWHSYRFKDGT